MRAAPLRNSGVGLPRARAGRRRPTSSRSRPWPVTRRCRPAESRPRTSRRSRPTGRPGSTCSRRWPPARRRGPASSPTRRAVRRRSRWIAQAASFRRTTAALVASRAGPSSTPPSRRGLERGERGPQARRRQRRRRPPGRGRRAGSARRARRAAGGRHPRGRRRRRPCRRRRGRRRRAGRPRRSTSGRMSSGVGGSRSPGRRTTAMMPHMAGEATRCGLLLAAAGMPESPSVRSTPKHVRAVDVRHEGLRVRQHGAREHAVADVDLDGDRPALGRAAAQTSSSAGPSSSWSSSSPGGGSGSTGAPPSPAPRR